MKFKMLINIEIAKVGGTFGAGPVICPASECWNANNCWHFGIYERDKFHARLG